MRIAAACGLRQPVRGRGTRGREPVTWCRCTKPSTPSPRWEPTPRPRPLSCMRSPRPQGRCRAYQRPAHTVPWELTLGGHARRWQRPAEGRTCPRHANTGAVHGAWPSRPPARHDGLTLPIRKARGTHAPGCRVRCPTQAPAASQSRPVPGAVGRCRWNLLPARPSACQVCTRAWRVARPSRAPSCPLATPRRRRRRSSGAQTGGCRCCGLCEGC
mmetsp:Transcript_22062/g.49821  ORF Transcript_22062/g.49821 Transcript_22062/m.49821 type:complete len:215 (-) Transcript_22062:432-1076(-)